MHDVGCGFLFACLLATVLATSSFKEYQFNPNIQKKTCQNIDNAFKASNVPTSLACSSICAADVHCKSFFYFPTSLGCDGCKQTYSTDEQLKSTGEQIVYYAMIDKLSVNSTAQAGNAYRYIGCFTSLCQGGQPCNYSIVYPIFDVNVTSCFDFCESSVGVREVTVALEAIACYCDVEYNDTLTADCDIPCEGNPDEMCGGENAISVYSNS